MVSAITLASAGQDVSVPTFDNKVATSPFIILESAGIPQRTLSADGCGKPRRDQPAEYDGRLIFSFGVNDCVYDSHGSIRVSPTDSFENARDILTEASTWLPTLFIGPPPTVVQS